MYGGHEIFDSSIIDEGIETTVKVIAGTDDKVKTTGMTGKDICYAYKKNDDGSNEGGHRFNMSYDPRGLWGMMCSDRNNNNLRDNTSYYLQVLFC